MAKKLRGVILYSRSEDSFTDADYSVSCLLQVARTRGIDIQVLRPDQFEFVIGNSDAKSIFVDNKEEVLPDFVLPRMGADTTYYALSVIRHLEYLGAYVCNNADAIYSVKDKLLMHQLLARSKLSSPRSMLAKFPISEEVVERHINFPLVIKNVTGKQGAGIYLCESKDKFVDVMDLIYVNNKSANIILQEFIQNSFGRDLRVFVIGGKVIGCMERVAKSGFKANVSKGAEARPFEATPEIEWLATETAKLFKLDIAGIDLLFDKNELKVCEANSSPGFKGLDKVVDSPVAESIIDYIMVRTGHGAGLA